MSQLLVLIILLRNTDFFQIKIWFQNRRARERREHGKVGQSPPPRQQPGGPVKSAFTPLPVTRVQGDDATTTTTETVSKEPCQVTLHNLVPLKTTGLRWRCDSQHQWDGIQVALRMSVPLWWECNSLRAPSLTRHHLC